MAANTVPIFPVVGQMSWVTVTTANTTKTLTSGTIYTLFTADGTNGSRLDTIKVRHQGTNSTATVLRIFINNAGSTGTAGNNSLYMERTIATNTNSETAESTDYEIPMDLVLPPGYVVYVTIGTAANLQVTAVGGKY